MSYRSDNKVYAFHGWSSSSPSTKSNPTANARREIAATRRAREALSFSSNQRKATVKKPRAAKPGRKMSCHV